MKSVINSGSTDYRKRRISKHQRRISNPDAQMGITALASKAGIIIIAGLILLSGCAQKRLQFLHGVTEHRQTLKILSRPNPMQIFLDDEFLGITPLATELWFRNREKLVISAKGMGDDTTFHTFVIRYDSTPRTITFFSGTDLTTRVAPANEQLDIPQTSGVMEAPSSPSAAVCPDCILPAIHFKFDDSEVSPAGIEQLISVRELLKTDPDYNLEIHGYADEQGSAVYNRKLSLKRAKSVYQQLVDLGVDNSRLFVYGHGEIATLRYDGFELEYAESRVVHFRLYRP